jgi:thioredoxin-related protein
MKLHRFLAGLAVAAVSTVAFAANESWMSDLEAAKARAAKEQKQLLVEFTGSAWCPPCQALHAKVLTTPEFAAFSHNLVLVALDYPPMSERTPEKIRANAALGRLMALKEKYAVPGFPTMLLCDANGQELARVVGYDGRSTEAYLAKLTPGAK